MNEEQTSGIGSPITDEELDAVYRWCDDGRMLTAGDALRLVAEVRRLQAEIGQMRSGQ